MKIYIIRHGKALSVEEAKVSSDEERPLAKKGQKDIASLGQRLKAKSARPEIIFVSPMLRAQQTANILSQAFNPKLGVKTVRSLNGQVSIPDLWKTLHKEIKKGLLEIVLVGHMPQLGELVGFLAKNEAPQLNPGTAVALEFDDQKPAQILWIENPLG